MSIKQVVYDMWSEGGALVTFTQRGELTAKFDGHVWSAFWPYPNRGPKDIRVFLAGISKGYLKGRFGVSDAVDFEATRTELKKMVLAARREECLDEEEARDEWNFIVGADDMDEVFRESSQDGYDLAGCICVKPQPYWVRFVPQFKAFQAALREDIKERPFEVVDPDWCREDKETREAHKATVVVELHRWCLSPLLLWTEPSSPFRELVQEMDPAKIELLSPEWPTWPDWVPMDVREQIESFSRAGFRGYARNYGAYSHSFGCLVKTKYDRRNKPAVGRYVHAWNNMGRLITLDGVMVVSSGSVEPVRLEEMP